LRLLPNVLQIETATPTTSNYSFDTQAKAFQDQNLEQAVSFQLPTTWPPLPKSSVQQINLTAEISQNLKSGVHLLVTDINVDEFKTPKWWAEWSAGEESRDGSRTHNLSLFMEGLKTITEQRKPAIARLCYLVQK
jgi:hypothetical protein